MDVEEKIKLITRNTLEIVTLEDLRRKIESGEKLKGYLGYEPSGLFHIGWMIWAMKVNDLVDAGIDFTLLEATWHAWVNDKLGGDMEAIRDAARYLRHSLKALGTPVEKIRFIDAETLVDDKDYWAILLRAAKHTTLSRAKRALTIMGRKEKDAEMDTSKLFYPFMQVADIFYMEIDLALGGMDQRRAHMLARELAVKLGFKKPVGIHTPLLTSLEGVGRAGGGGIRDTEAIDYKMSKSKPQSTILIHDPPDTIREKIRKAYCPPKQIEHNPIMEINKYILYTDPSFKLYVERPQKYGGDIEIESYSELEKIYLSGSLHPLDLKKATAEALIERLKPVREYFKKNRNAWKIAEKIADLQGIKLE